MHVAIIGLGGTGSILSEPLLRYMNSKSLIEKVMFVDGDKYEASNVDRQLFAAGYEGMNKAEYAHLKFTSLFPAVAENMTFIPKYLGEPDLEKVMPEGGVLFCCVDNHWFRRIADERCTKMKNFVLISAGNELTNGNVQIVQMLDGVNITKTSVCKKYSGIRTASKDEDRSEMSCEQIQKLPGGGQIVAANMMAATLMLCYFMQYVESPDKRAFFETYFDCMRGEAANREVS